MAVEEIYLRPQLLGSVYLGLFLTMAGSMTTSVASHVVLYIHCSHISFVGGIIYYLLFSLTVTWIFWLAAAC